MGPHIWGLIYGDPSRIDRNGPKNTYTDNQLIPPKWSPFRSFGPLPLLETLHVAYGNLHSSCGKPPYNEHMQTYTGPTRSLRGAYAEPTRSLREPTRWL